MQMNDQTGRTVNSLMLTETNSQEGKWATEFIDPGLNISL